jgi:hypothetical protein
VGCKKLCMMYDMIYDDTYMIYDDTYDDTYMICNRQVSRAEKAERAYLLCSRKIVRTELKQNMTANEGTSYSRLFCCYWI